MIRKTSIATSIVAAFGLSVAAHSAFAQNRIVPAVTFGEEEAMIKVLSTEETEVPGYVHQQYLVRCNNVHGVNVVDRYGPAINADDPSLIQSELRFCHEDRDGESSDSGD